jgi:PAS domain S-box-containing protein
MEPGETKFMITCFGKDITDSHQAEEQLRKLSRAVEQSPNTVMITNASGNIEYVNPKFSEVSGYSADDVMGKNPRFLQSGDTSQEEYKKLWRTIVRGEQWRGLFHNKKKTGELYWEYTAISGVRNNEGKITHYLAVKEDVTERKRMEVEIEMQSKELTRSQTLAALGRMASMIAHDLRNPLSSIKMTLQILGKPATANMDAEKRELQQIALEQVRYMDEILNDLLNFSRPAELQPKWLDINKCLDHAVSTASKAIHEHSATIKTQYEKSLPTVHGDITKLYQVFNNLILNALQATEEAKDKAYLHIRTSLEVLDNNPKVRIEIEDNGTGFDVTEKDKLFEPFYTTRAKGTGLGLAIVKRIVDQHHGDVFLMPVKSGGTCSVVVLPTEPI